MWVVCGRYGVLSGAGELDGLALSLGGGDGQTGGFGEAHSPDNCGLQHMSDAHCWHGTFSICFMRNCVPGAHHRHVEWLSWKNARWNRGFLTWLS
jgi:hypothetical protein